MFAYRGKGLADSAAAQIGSEVQQTDLAPTLSAALGRPPPAPSLGSLLLPVLPKMSISHTLLHVTNNLKQVRVELHLEALILNFLYFYPILTLETSPTVWVFFYFSPRLRNRLEVSACDGNY